MLIVNLLANINKGIINTYERITILKAVLHHSTTLLFVSNILKRKSLDTSQQPSFSTHTHAKQPIQYKYNKKKKNRACKTPLRSSPEHRLRKTV